MSVANAGMQEAVHAKEAELATVREVAAVESERAAAVLEEVMGKPLFAQSHNESVP